MTHHVIIGLIAWSIFLIIALITFRSVLVLTGKKEINDFTTDGSDIGEGNQRYMRAVYNSLENLPILIGTLLLASVMNMSLISDQVAAYILLARMAQSIVHIISTSHIAVAARVTFYLIQMAACVYILAELYLATA